MFQIASGEISTGGAAIGQTSSLAELTAPHSMSATGRKRTFAGARFVDVRLGWKADVAVVRIFVTQSRTRLERQSTRGRSQAFLGGSASLRAHTVALGAWELASRAET